MYKNIQLNLNHLFLKKTINDRLRSHVFEALPGYFRRECLKSASSRWLVTGRAAEAAHGATRVTVDEITAESLDENDFADPDACGEPTRRRLERLVRRSARAANEILAGPAIAQIMRDAADGRNVLHLQAGAVAFRPDDMVFELDERAPLTRACFRVEKDRYLLRFGLNVRMTAREGNAIRRLDGRADSKPAYYWELCFMTVVINDLRAGLFCRTTQKRLFGVDVRVKSLEFVAYDKLESLLFNCMRRVVCDLDGPERCEAIALRANALISKCSQRAKRIASPPPPPELFYSIKDVKGMLYQHGRDALPAIFWLAKNNRFADPLRNIVGREIDFLKGVYYDCETENSPYSKAFALFFNLLSRRPPQAKWTTQKLIDKS
ncbi:ORF151 [Lymantria xylina nucleopolyhedrovirus]|uniref:ORF151 n=1 Tax=Lymantria xylina multiple nucleopolyhedrovirus TaxID=2847840 RepID=D4N2I8_9ABAC|nr:ORF151 [Lymantria xylina nucleopolyhedrovirus]ADD73860.1 ORF151 [Lymantria xylina nucleopolyhedrovirus]